MEKIISDLEMILKRLPVVEKLKGLSSNDCSTLKKGIERSLHKARGHVLVYELISENLTGLGGPMGSEKVFNNFSKIFSFIGNCKAEAEKDYGTKINWKNFEDRITSGDLGHVMYIIKEKYIE